MIQTSRLDFDGQELQAMITDAGLTRGFIYPVWLSKLLAISRTDSHVIESLRNLRQIVYGGGALSPEDEAWVVANNLPITVSENI